MNSTKVLDTGVFRGPFEKCLENFMDRFNANYPPGTAHLKAFRSPIAYFCGVKDDSVRHWLNGKDIPKGRTKLTATCYLELHNYKVTEFEKISVVLRNFTELIGYGVISPEEACRLVGYKESSALYEALRNSRDSNREKEEKMLTIWEEKKEELEWKKKDSLRFRLNILPETEPRALKPERKKEEHLEEKKEILREHFDECLKHFGNLFSSIARPGSRNRLEKMRPMADFCGASVGTVQRWIDNNSSPAGGVIFKLMCYLDLHGYKVIEFERLASRSKMLRGYAELMGFGLLSNEEATQLAGYATTGRLFEVLNEKTGLSPDKEEKMWAVWKERRDSLESAKIKARQEYYLDFLFESQTTGSSQQLSLPAVSKNNGVQAAGHSALLSILEGSLDLLEGSLLGEISDVELGKFAQPILKLSSRLSVLSSRVLTLKGDK